jgi:ribosomal protein S18 acetylase RimI-like enzyme
MVRKLEYIEGKEELLEEIDFLWEKLNEMHKAKSKYFSKKFESFKFEKRKVGLIEKGRNGDIKVITVKDLVESKLIGYLICSIDRNNNGEIDSLYVESEYRGYGIGDKLMESSLNWFEKNNIKKIRIGVAVGNEEVLTFYGRYGFYPSVTILENIEGDYIEKKFKSDCDNRR